MTSHSKLHSAVLRCGWFIAAASFWCSSPVLFAIDLGHVTAENCAQKAAGLFDLVSEGALTKIETFQLNTSSERLFSLVSQFEKVPVAMSAKRIKLRMEVSERLKERLDLSKRLLVNRSKLVLQADSARQRIAPPSDPTGKLFATTNAEALEEAAAALFAALVNHERDQLRGLQDKVRNVLHPDDPVVVRLEKAIEYFESLSVRSPASVSKNPKNVKKKGLERRTPGF